MHELGTMEGVVSSAGEGGVYVTDAWYVCMYMTYLPASTCGRGHGMSVMWLTCVMSEWASPICVVSTNVYGYGDVESAHLCQGLVYIAIAIFIYITSQVYGVGVCICPCTHICTCM